MDRFVARKKIIEELKAIGLFVKTENITHNVGVSERTGAVIEPKFSHQWFLKMDDLVKPAIKSVLKSEEINFYPKKFDNTFRNWMENIRDWNISRQLYWGHQIPVYYYGENNEKYVVAESIDKAVELVKKRTGNNKVNSISYNIKNTHNIAKFILICMLMSDKDLNPHSQKYFFAVWFFIL